MASVGDCSIEWGKVGGEVPPPPHDLVTTNSTNLTNEQRQQQPLRDLWDFAVQCLDHGTIFTCCKVTDPFWALGAPCKVVVPDQDENDVFQPP